MKVHYILYRIFFLLLINVLQCYQNLLDLNFVTYTKKDSETIPVYNFYIHNMGIKIAKGSYFIKTHTQDEYEILILMSCNNAYDIEITNKEFFEDEHMWHINLKTDTRMIRPLIIEKINEKYKYDTIFNKKNIRFGTLYKVYWNPSAYEEKQEIVLSHGLLSFTLPINIVSK
jgi:hypothetical protein